MVPMAGQPAQWLPQSPGQQGTMVPMPPGQSGVMIPQPMDMSQLNQQFGGLSIPSGSQYGSTQAAHSTFSHSVTQTQHVSSSTGHGMNPYGHATPAPMSPTYIPQQTLPSPPMQPQIQAPPPKPKKDYGVTENQRGWAARIYRTDAMQQRIDEGTIHREEQRLRSGDNDKEVFKMVQRNKQEKADRERREREENARRQQEQELAQHKWNLEQETRQKQEAAEREIAHQKAMLQQQQQQTQQAMQNEAARLAQQKQQIDAKAARKQAELAAQEQSIQATARSQADYHQQLQTHHQNVSNQAAQMQQQMQQMMTTTTTTLTTSQQVMLNATQATGSRKQAIEQGPQAVEAWYARVNPILMRMACPMNLGWMATADGFLCAGGNHFIPDTEIDRALTSRGRYRPMVKITNAVTGILLPGEIRGPRFVKPPPGTPRLWPCHITYRRAKRFGRAFWGDGGDSDDDDIGDDSDDSDDSMSGGNPNYQRSPYFGRPMRGFGWGS